MQAQSAPGAPAPQPSPQASPQITPNAPTPPSAPQPTAPPPSTAPEAPAPVINGVRLSPGTAVMVRVVSVATSPATTPTTTAPAPPALSYGPAPGAGTAAPWLAPTPSTNPQAVLTGTVLPGATAGQTLVQTPAGTLAVSGRLAAPPGAQIGLEVLRQATPPPTVGMPLAAGPAAAASATVWPSLTEALHLLGGSDGEAARRLAAVLPQADGRMLASIAGYTAAVQAGGDTRQWPGNAVMRALERTGERGERIARALKGELAEASTLRRDTAGTDWRVTTLPFHIGGEVQRIQMISRRQSSGDDGDGQGGDGGGKGSGQRFLITLDLSRLGAVQIDGLFRQAERRFDLILRTHQPLPQEMRRDLTGLFANTVSALGLAGGLGFHVTPAFETPLPETAADGSGRPGLFA